MVRNGTVTMDVITSGIEADNFSQAIEKLLAICNKKKVKLTSEKRTNSEFSYRINGDFPVDGYLTDKPLKMLE